MVELTLRDVDAEVVVKPPVDSGRKTLALENEAVTSELVCNARFTVPEKLPRLESVIVALPIVVTLNLTFSGLELITKSGSGTVNGNKRMFGGRLPIVAVKLRTYCPGETDDETLTVT